MAFDNARSSMNSDYSRNQGRGNSGGYSRGGRGRSGYRDGYASGGRGGRGGQGFSGRGGGYSGGNRGPKRWEDTPRREEGSDKDLIGRLQRLDGRSYGGYKSVIGDWDYGDFSLAIDHIQSDPYAPPSSLRAIARPEAMGLPAEALASGDARLATADFLVRAFDQAIRRADTRDVRIARTGQEILQRSAATVMPDKVEIRFQVQMPARGRSILGNTAARLFDVTVPDIIMETLDFVSDDAAPMANRLRGHIATYEDYRALQQILADRGWVAFLANDSILARKSGISELPMVGAVPFESPESLQQTVTLPHAGEVTGMAMLPGVTVIVGGGYHGKSTLLGAIQRGVYAHVPGDGRELVATVPDAMKIRAADGRAVTRVNVSPFITHLPGGADTTNFSTENASGSTSQAAAIVEAVELGASLLLLDEDTSATNLLIRDARMRELVHADKEPITPLVDRVGSLAHDRGVSTIMVMGGSGDYLDVADHVLMLDTYRCFEVTERARQVVAAQPRQRTDLPFEMADKPRILTKYGTVPDRQKTKSSGLNTIQLDRHTVDVSDVEQILDAGQTETIAWAIRGVVQHFADGSMPLTALLDRLERRFQSEGLDAVVKFGARQYPAFLVRPRRVDIGAAINRYRLLSVTSAVAEPDWSYGPSTDSADTSTEPVLADPAEESLEVMSSESTRPHDESGEVAPFTLGFKDQ